MKFEICDCDVIKHEIGFPSKKKKEIWQKIQQKMHRYNTIELFGQDLHGEYIYINIIMFFDFLNAIYIGWNI